MRFCRFVVAFFWCDLLLLFPAGSCPELSPTRNVSDLKFIYRYDSVLTYLIATDLVTETDRGVEKMVSEILRAKFPGYA
jgi:hypothetical protein